MQTENTQHYNIVLDLCLENSKIKGVIQKSQIDILETDETQTEFLEFINSQIFDQVFKKKISAFQNNLNQKSTQELHFDIGEDEALTEVIKLKRDPKSTLPQSERPYIFILGTIEAPKVKTLEEEIIAFKKAMAKKFDAELTIEQK